MILRFYKTIQIGKKERLLIEFKENKYEILSTFLESDVSPFEEWIKSAFDRVLSGKVNMKKYMEMYVVWK